MIKNGYSKNNDTNNTHYIINWFQALPRELWNPIFEHVGFFDLSGLSRGNKDLNLCYTKILPILYDREVESYNPLKCILSYMPRSLFYVQREFISKAEKLFKYCILHKKLNVEMMKIYNTITDDIQKNYLLVFCDIMESSSMGEAVERSRECSKVLQENKNLKKYALIVGVMIQLRKYSDEGLNYLQLLEGASEEKISEVQLLIANILYHRNDLSEDQKKMIEKLLTPFAQVQSKLQNGKSKTLKKYIKRLLVLFTKHENSHYTGVSLPGIPTANLLE